MTILGLRTNHSRGGQESGVRRRIRVPPVAIAFRSAHSASAFLKKHTEGDGADVLPVSSTMDRRTVVEWGSNKQSRLCVCPAIAGERDTNADGQP